MPLNAVEITDLLPPFLLVLFRISGLTLAAPIFSSSGIPIRAKIGFTFVTALMIAPTVWHTLPTRITLPDVVSAVFGELLIGLILGFSVTIVFVGARMAGMLIGQQAGLAMGRVMNPMADGQSTLVGQMFFLVYFMIFLGAGGHLAMVAALLDTFQAIPPGSFRFSESFLTLAVQLLSAAMAMSIRLAAPALIALFMTSLAMGFLSRTIPQLNVLTVGFAVRILVGLSVAAISLPFALDIILDDISGALDLIRGAFGLG